MQAVVAEHMSREARRLEYFRESRVADAQAPGIGAECRHDRALAVAGKTAPLHPPRACRHPRLGMKVACDLAGRTGRLVTNRDWPNRDFAGDDAAEIGWQGGIVVAGNPDPVAPRLQRRDGVAVGRRQSLVGVRIVKTVAE